MQIDPVDIDHQYRVMNGSNQGLEQFPGFHFVIKEGCQNFEGKNSNHVLNESINTDTHVCGIFWLECLPFKDLMNFIYDCIKVDTLVIDEFRTIEKSNSVTSWNQKIFFPSDWGLKDIHIKVLTSIYSFSRSIIVWKLGNSSDWMYTTKSRTSW